MSPLQGVFGPIQSQTIDPVPTVTPREATCCVNASQYLFFKAFRLFLTACVWQKTRHDASMLELELPVDVGLVEAYEADGVED